MDELDSLGQRYKDKIAAVKQYLAGELNPAEIRQSEDFDRDGVVLRTGRGRQGFRLFISHEFLSDFTIEVITARLRGWRVEEGIRQLPPGFTLFLTTGGIFKERTEGRTVREVTQTFEGILPLSQRRKQLYDRVFSIRVDGEPLGETHTECQGDSDLYVTYSTEFAQALGAAYLLDAAGYQNFELRRTPELYDSGIDFEVTLFDGRRVFLDFKRALNAKAARESALREQINVGLRRAMRDDAVVRQAIDGRFIQITIPIAPESKAEVDATVSEILRFATSTNWATLASNSFVAFDAGRFPLLARLDANVYMAQGSTYLSAVEGATSFDPYAPYNEASQIVAREAQRRFGASPMWLGVSLADVAALIPDDMIDSRWPLLFNVEFTPFEQIIIGSADKAKRFQKTVK
jgi:hypothetical protein